jgi:sugar lactone lactonase YvrE
MSDCTPLKAHILRDYRLTGWSDRIAGRWHYRDLVADDEWRLGWISFDAVAWNPDDRSIYCGLNSLDGDLLYRFDPVAGTFCSLNARRWADAFDSKIHRTLLYNRSEKAFYFATSLLHDVDRQREAPGGKIVRYDPAADRFDVLGIPAPMLYIQSIAADFQRGLLYGFTYPAETFFMFDLAARRAETLAYTGNSLFFSQPHNPVVDAEGWVWGTYAETRAWDETLGEHPIRLFKFHPQGRRFVWFDRGLPRKTDSGQLARDPDKPDVASRLAETRHRDDFGFCDSMLFDGSRYIYAGTVAGVLSRIDTFTDRVEKVAHVMAAGRFPALCMDAGGTLYGAGGMSGQTQLMRWRPGSDRIDGFYNLLDPELGDGPARIHEMAVGDAGELYLAENDNHRRSSYLWTARL